MQPCAVARLGDAPPIRTWLPPASAGPAGGLPHLGGGPWDRLLTLAVRLCARWALQRLELCCRLAATRRDQLHAPLGRACPSWCAAEQLHQNRFRPGPAPVALLDATA